MEHSTDRYVTRELPASERSAANRPQYARVESEEQVRSSRP
jgi:hypothetical protein